ncbi:MAG: isochorismatase family protein [Chloroflexi bacterium]|nr:isochorismatase family protein [Chloroflexota bacterium]
MATGNGRAASPGTGERVWDRFLSEQDRAHAAMRTHRTRGFGERPALLLIDLYRWVFGDAPQPLLEAAEAWPGTCGLAAWSAVPHIQQLLEVAREAGIPIIHTTGLDEPDRDAWAKRSRAAESSAPDEAMADRLRRRFDIIEEVAPVSGERVIRKSSPSAFWGTPLVGYLVDRGVDTIIVGGESTSGCVRASVVDGCTYRYRMTVVEECVFDRHEAPHAIDLFTMNQKYADVLPLTEVLGYLTRFSGGRPVERGGRAAARV